jgi:molybdopterin synthase catalytic subunit
MAVAAIRVLVQQEDFKLDDLMARLREAKPQIGAIACFVGTVRDVNDGDSVSSMFLEHYPGMTEHKSRTYRSTGGFAMEA